MVEQPASWKAGSSSAPNAEETKQANPYDELVVLVVNRNGKAEYNSRIILVV